jgi:hypothetical protein
MKQTFSVAEERIAPSCYSDEPEPESNVPAMDLPPTFGDKFYPVSHLLGYRNHHTYKRGHPKVFRSLRSKPWFTKAENILQTFIGGCNLPCGG